MIEECGLNRMPVDLPQNRIALVVAEHEVTSRLLCYLLQEEGYEVVVLHLTGDTEFLVPGRPDVILLEVCLTSVDSFTLCRNLRGRSNLRFAPIIMFGHECTATERLAGLQAGAHDVISGPFDYRELLAKIRCSIGG